MTDYQKLPAEIRNIIEKEIKFARGCLNFKGFTCENKDCKAVGCPLNSKYEGEDKDDT